MKGSRQARKLLKSSMQKAMSVLFGSISSESKKDKNKTCSIGQLFSYANFYT